jgi:hypothetical protein
MDKNINAYKILVGKPDGKRPLGRARRRWADMIKICEISGSHGGKYEV